jgi:ketopantoate reductase
MIFFSLRAVWRLVEVYETSHCQDHEEKGQATRAEFLQGAVIDVVKEVCHKCFIRMRIISTIKNGLAYEINKADEYVLPESVLTDLLPQI